ncbi:MAG: GspE/PulE family protein, partial [Sphingomonadales bacterium]
MVAAGEHMNRPQLEAALAAALAEEGRIDSETLARAQQLAAQEKRPLWQVLPRLGMIAESQLAETLSKTFDLPLVSADDFPDKPLFGDRVSARFLRKYSVLPLSENKTTVTVATASPDCDYLIEALGQSLGKKIKVNLAPPSEIEAALDRLYDDGSTAMARLAEAGEAGPARPGEEDMELLRDSASGAPVVQLVNLIIERAVEAGASDIHLEPYEDQLVARFRIDGILKKVEGPPARLRDAVISRIKLMAGLDIGERRLPQDGRIKHPVRGVPVDMRISTMPTLSGESVVLRILDRSTVELKLESLGFDGEARKTIDRLIRRPNGIILVAGPTGSGKTTTLYTALQMINDDSRKIQTVEDPVEYQLPGIVQTQVRANIGLGFAKVLRSTLRHDPDVIMVGEIRDLETAEIAVQAALTGHTVFSTLHTTSAVESITRLVDMGIKPYLLAATLGGVIAQRLVRRLCQECKTETTVDARELGWALNGGDGKETYRVWKAQGCEACS